jgi:preprotein translocase subunit SecF
MKWVLNYSLICIGAIVGVLVFVWALNGFDLAGISTAGLIAVILGTTFTVLVAVGLMGLVFYSNRSGQDDRANRSGER